MGKAVITRFDDTPEHASVLRVLENNGHVVYHIEAGVIYVASKGVNKSTLVRYAAKQRQ